jgi:hypothetical protein
MTMIPNGLNGSPPRLPGIASRDPAAPPFVRVPPKGRDRDRSNIDGAIPAPRIAGRPLQSAFGRLAACCIQIAITGMFPALLP